MKVAIIGTGAVGQTLASRLVELGHDVIMGTRSVSGKLSSVEKDSYGNPLFSAWYNSNLKVRLESFAEAAANGEIIVNATHGESSVTALKLAGSKNLSGKVVIDVSNPLDFSKGMPPSLIPALCNTNSLGEELQRTFPEARVVKTLNSMWCGLMVNPGMVGDGDHINYISGNDTVAKATVRDLLKEFGWRDENIIDLGDITGARATESLLPIWLRILGVTNTPAFNFRLVR